MSHLDILNAELTVCSSDADADVLADYVLALLRHDDTADNIRKMFDEEIPDFLREGMHFYTLPYPEPYVLY